MCCGEIGNFKIVDRHTDTHTDSTVYRVAPQLKNWEQTDRQTQRSEYRVAPCINLLALLVIFPLLMVDREREKKNTNYVWL